MTTADTHATIDAIWRVEAPKIIGGLTRLVRDLATAEDLAHDALVAALEQWPTEGVPAKPGTWLMATAKHRAIDRIRRSATFARKLEVLGAEIATAASTPDPDAAFDDTVQDDVLRLIFMACHPVLSPEARVALTLRLVGGLTTSEIARAYLVLEPTMAQRLVRAKKLLARERPSIELRRARRVRCVWRRCSGCCTSCSTRGPAAALPLVDALAGAPALRGYHYVPAVRADLLAKLGRHDQARAEFARAAALTANERERAMLLAKSRKGPLTSRGLSIWSWPVRRLSVSASRRRAGRRR